MKTKQWMKRIKQVVKMAKKGDKIGLRMLAAKLVLQDQAAQILRQKGYGDATTPLIDIVDEIEYKGVCHVLRDASTAPKDIGPILMKIKESISDDTEYFRVCWFDANGWSYQDADSVYPVVELFIIGWMPLPVLLHEVAE